MRDFYVQIRARQAEEKIVMEIFTYSTKLRSKTHRFHHGKQLKDLSNRKTKNEIHFIMANKVECSTYINTINSI